MVQLTTTDNERTKTPEDQIPSYEELVYEELINKKESFRLITIQKDVLNKKYPTFADYIGEKFLSKLTNLAEIDNALKTQFSDDNQARIDCIKLLGKTIGMRAGNMVLLMRQITQKPSQPTAPGPRQPKSPIAQSIMSRAPRD